MSKIATTKPRKKREFQKTKASIGLRFSIELNERMDAYIGRHKGELEKVTKIGLFEKAVREYMDKLERLEKGA